jgi:hypothetical protein
MTRSRAPRRQLVSETRLIHRGVSQPWKLCDRLWTGTKHDRRSSHKPSVVAHSATDHATWRRSVRLSWPHTARQQRLGRGSGSPCRWRWRASIGPLRRLTDGAERHVGASPIVVSSQRSAFLAGVIPGAAAEAVAFLAGLRMASGVTFASSPGGGSGSCGAPPSRKPPTTRLSQRRYGQVHHLPDAPPHRQRGEPGQTDNMRTDVGPGRSHLQVPVAP